MKRTLLSLLLCLATMMLASAEDSKYLAGAVPEVNGVVTFQKTFRVKGHTDAQISATLLRFVADSLVGQGIQDLRTRLISDGTADGHICAKVEEYIVFKKRFLNFDRTRLRYQITATVDQGQVTLVVNQLSYYYNEDREGKGGIPYKAEEWITDKAAVNKAGTKLYPRSGKFRRKTIDRIQAIFEAAMDAFDVQPQLVKQKRVRSNIEE